MRQSHKSDINILMKPKSLLQKTDLINDQNIPFKWISMLKIFFVIFLWSILSVQKIVKLFVNFLLWSCRFRIKFENSLPNIKAVTLLGILLWYRQLKPNWFTQFCFFRSKLGLTRGIFMEDKTPQKPNLVLFPQFSSSLAPLHSLLGVLRAPHGPFLRCAYACQ